MRSHSLARAVLRSAARNSTTTTYMLRPTSFNAHPAVDVTRKGGLPCMRGFSSSDIELKKKSNKNAFGAVEEDWSLENHHDDGEFAIEDDDELFGSVSDVNTAGTSTSTEGSSMSRVDFAKALEEYRRCLEWESIDRGQFPSLSRWRNLAGHAVTQAELEQSLELAKLYRDRVGSLGLKSGRRFASRASKVNLPEVALNAFLDRYAYGLEYDLESLYLVQRALMTKLDRGEREEILASAELAGAPVQETDLLGVVPPSEGARAEAESGEDGKAEAISSSHELDMPLARAQLSIIDRMAFLASISTTSNSSNNTTSLDPTLLSYIPHAYIKCFGLISNPTTSSNPLLTNIFARTDDLISLLTLSARRALSTTNNSTITIGATATLSLQRSIRLGKHFTSTLSYVARRGQTKFTDPSTGKSLDPVRTLYRYMDRVAPQASNVLVRKVEPLFQTYSSL